MKKLAIRGNLILEDRIIKNGLLLIKDGLIEDILESDRDINPAEVELQDFSGCWVSPGLVDVHLHGALGCETMDGEVDSLRKMAEHQARCGVTSFFPTTLTASREKILKAIEAVIKASREDLPSEIAGIHLEGPFVSLKRKGAQDPKYVREITAEEVDEYKERLGNLRTIITVASEVGQNLRFIPKMVEMGWTVSLGHSDSTYEEGRQAVASGVTHATHLFNAWKEFHHREPGGLGAVLDGEKVCVELIADGVHVHPSFIRLAIYRKGPNRVCLITDSLKESGLPDGLYDWGELQVVLRGNEIRLKDSGVLAGSVLHLNHGVRNVLAWTGFPVPDVIRMASLTPAENVGLAEEIGSLRKGKKANIAIFDENFECLATYLKGRRVF